MPKHRVEINVQGMSHFVDERLVDATGFPLWSTQLPDGLRLGRPPDRRRQFVRTERFGASIEWTSNRVWFAQSRDSLKGSQQFVYRMLAGPEGLTVEQSRRQNDGGVSRQDRNDECSGNGKQKRTQKRNWQDREKDEIQGCSMFLRLVTTMMTMTRTSGYNLMISTIRWRFTDVESAGFFKAR